jgi:hypothetical protein
MRPVLFVVPGDMQVSVGFRLFRIVQVERRIQGGREERALGQKNAGGSGIEFVAGDCVGLDEPP